ncbi:MAG: winged helix-turn-helix domain-containing protein [Caldilineaceae bacterium]
MSNAYQDPSLAYWRDFPQTYRQEQIATVAAWAQSGESGVLVGGAGMGKSNLLGFLTTRPDALQLHMPAHAADTHIIRFDSNSLPAFTVAYFYRGLLFALREGAGQFGAECFDAVEAIIQAQADWNDAFLVHAALVQAHAAILQRTAGRLLWLLDRFDEACAQLDVQALNTLRNLRDRFKGRLCYVMATRQPLARLRDPAEFDELYELFAGRTGWVGCMVERDVRWVASQMAERLHTTFSDMQVQQLQAVTGGLPAFLKEGSIALAQGGLDANASVAALAQQLLARPEFQRICGEIWRELSPDEQQAMINAVHENRVDRTVADPYLTPGGLLIEEGGRWCIFSPIMAAFVTHQAAPASVIEPPKANQATRSSGLALHPKTRAVLRNGVALDIELTPQEELLLDYFLQNEEAVCTKDELMQAVWAEDAFVEGIRDDRLAQLIKRLRSKIELKQNSPTHILTVRGRGYRFVNA